MAHVEFVGATPSDPDDLLGAEMLILDADMGDEAAAALLELEDLEEGDEPLVDEQHVQNLLTRQIEAAIAYREDNIEQAQVDATDYYYARPFGNEEEGRSKVVSSDLRDAVLQVMPSLLRIFFGSERVVEFEPEGEEDSAGAAQKSDYMNYIITQDNKGFLIFHAVLKDALVRRLGIIKYWWNEFFRVEQREYTRLDFSQLLILLEDEELDLDIPTLERAGEEDDPITGEPVEIYNVSAKRKIQNGRVAVAAVPPEEFIYSGDARSLDDASLTAHVREVPRDELVAMDVPEDMIDEAVSAHSSANLQDDNLIRVRKLEENDAGVYIEDTELPEEIRPVLYAEAYMLFDGDGDGIAELRRFDCVGPKFTIVPNEDGQAIGRIVSRRPFALFPMDPEPHTIMGMSFFDLLKDIQKINSQIERATLDSLGLAVEPQQEVNAKAVNMKDLLDPELSGIIRVRGPVGTNIREVKHAFVGKDTLPILQYYGQKVERRTGQSAAAQGLDPDVLQSTTRAGVQATVSAAQARIEIIARVFAETGMTDLFRGMLELVIENQDKPRTVRLRNKWVEVDPRSWQATMDVRVNVALGTGLVEEKLAMLGMISQKQMELMSNGVPFVSAVEVRSTLAKISELAGFKNSAEFWKPWSAEDEKAHQEQLAQQPPQPDPASLIAEAEKMKGEAAMITAQGKLEIDRQKMWLEDDRDRDKVARDLALRERIAEIEFGREIHDSELKARVEADRTAMDADIQQLKILAASQMGGGAGGGGAGGGQ